VAELAPHLDEREVVCRLHGVLHAPPHPLLLFAWTQLRGLWGAPIRVTSGNRCEARQDQLRREGFAAARVSPHVARPTTEGLRFLALDLAAPEIAPDAWREIIRDACGPMVRIGTYPWGCHLDVAWSALATDGRGWARPGSWAPGVEWERGLEVQK